MMVMGKQQSIYDDWNINLTLYTITAIVNAARLHGFVRTIESIHIYLKKKNRQKESRNILDPDSGQGDLFKAIHTEIPTSLLMGFELSAIRVANSWDEIPRASFNEVDLLSPTW